MTSFSPYSGSMDSRQRPADFAIPADRPEDLAVDAGARGWVQHCPAGRRSTCYENATFSGFGRDISILFFRRKLLSVINLRLFFSCPSCDAILDLTVL